VEEENEDSYGEEDQDSVEGDVEDTGRYTNTRLRSRTVKMETENNTKEKKVGIKSTGGK
jgi:hypothetical protein